MAMDLSCRRSLAEPINNLKTLQLNSVEFLKAASRKGIEYLEINSVRIAQGLYFLILVIR